MTEKTPDTHKFPDPTQCTEWERQQLMRQVCGLEAPEPQETLRDKYIYL